MKITGRPLPWTSTVNERGLLSRSTNGSLAGIAAVGACFGLPPHATSDEQQRSEPSHSTKYAWI